MHKGNPLAKTEGIDLETVFATSVPQSVVKKPRKKKQKNINNSRKPPKTSPNVPKT